MSIDVLQLPSSEYEATLKRAMGIDKPDQNDVVQYKICCTTWVLLFDSCGVSTEWLVSLLREQGFYATIDDASNFAQRLCDKSINPLDDTIDNIVHFGGVRRELVGLFNSWVMDYSESRIIEFISLLRYPKRFTASKRFSDISKDYVEFIGHNKKLHLRMATRTPNANYVISRMKYHVRSFFTKPLRKAIHKAVVCYLHDEDVRHHIPTGVCADARTALEKMLVLQRNDKSILPFCPYDTPDSYLTKIPSIWVDVKKQNGPIPAGFLGPIGEAKLTPQGIKCVCEDKRTVSTPEGKTVRLVHGTWDVEKYHKSYCKITSVPKSFDEERIIGMEQVERQVRSDLLLPLLYDRLLVWSHGNINLNDQSVNRDAARRGSIDGSLATIDWHHASDGYSIEFVRAVMPSDVMSDLEQLRAQFLVGKDNIVYYNNIFLTMGHKLTPALQSLLFMCLCRTAEDVYSAVTRECLDNESLYDNIFIYNDDTIVPSQLAELVLQFGEAIGLEANLKKTFFSQDNLFRESCGGEFFQGVSLTPYYWPRTAISGRKRSDFVQYYDTLVSIQHRIFGYRKAATYFELCLREIFPKITYSNDLTDSVTDLFGPFRTQKIAEAPHDKGAVIPDSPLFQRTLHSCVVGTWPKPRGCSRELEQLAEYITYLDYLKFGPMYASKLDELLGVSMKRDPAQLYVDEVYQFTVKRQ